MQKKIQEEIYPDNLVELEQRLAELTTEQQDCIKNIKALLLKENPQQGIFYAQEIYAAQQLKLILECKKEFCRKKVNRINLGFSG